jgi:hypothetical protein
VATPASKGRSPRAVTNMLDVSWWEGAWNNRFKAQVARSLEVRQEGQPKIIPDISWKAQLRLSKDGTKVATEQYLRRYRPRTLRTIDTATIRPSMCYR